MNTGLIDSNCNIAPNYNANTIKTSIANGINPNAAAITSANGYAPLTHSDLAQLEVRMGVKIDAAIARMETLLPKSKDENEKIVAALIEADNAIERAIAYFRRTDKENRNER